jgi:hypothetical protein
MKTFAAISSDQVTSLLMAESKETAEELAGTTCVEYFLVQPGWSYIDNSFVPPAGEGE